MAMGESLAGAWISTSHEPQIAETCFCGQKTLSLRKEAFSSRGLMTTKEAVGDKYGSSGDRSEALGGCALARDERWSGHRAWSEDERGSAPGNVKGQARVCTG